MTRVLLISPTSTAANPNPAPPINLMYLVAALVRADIEVRVFDLASPAGPRGVEAVAECIDDWEPDLLGVSLFSEMALAAYRLIGRLGPRDGLVKVAGGPHATAEPEEALDHGFDVVVRGEGEQTLVELAQAVARGLSLESVRGVTFRTASGEVQHVASRPLLEDIDRLPSPLGALDHFPRDWYLADSSPAPLAVALLSSRGCPASCTFCANVVYGRRYRFHSAERVLDEMRDWHRREQTVCFSFCDAAFTVHRKRLMALCEGMATLPFRPLWWCETRVDWLPEKAARAMAKAGCVNVIVGIESGDPVVQRQIGKRIDLEAAVRTLRTAKEAGLNTQVNFMFGFPGETVEQLETSMRYMERIAPFVDLFTPSGILVPYPGSTLYERHHQELGFTRWWLDERKLASLNSAPDDIDPGESVEQALAWIAAHELSVLDANLVPYSDDVRRAIERCAAFRRDLNRQHWDELSARSTRLPV